MRGSAPHLGDVFIRSLAAFAVACRIAAATLLVGMPPVQWRAAPWRRPCSFGMLSSSCTPHGDAFVCWHTAFAVARRIVATALFVWHAAFLPARRMATPLFVVSLPVQWHAASWRRPCTSAYCLGSGTPHRGDDPALWRAVGLRYFSNFLTQQLRCSPRFHATTPQVRLTTCLQVGSACA